MQCPECHTENPEGKKFCRKCGAKFSLACPQCAAEILSDDRFCGECGYDLTAPFEPSPRELSFDEKLDKIQRYLPKGLTEKILAQRDRIEGERRQVTVMFCDMEGFTPLVEKLGPDEAYGIMDQVYEILIHKVHDYEGTVNEMTGDGVMALFGAPIALEDAPQRAIRSALAIHREMAMFSDRIRKEKQGIPPIKMRIGIHRGPVVVGTLGNNLRVEFKAVGETVNVASRMEGLAKPGTTYVTEDTFKLTEGFFRFEALGEKGVKGKKEPVKVYRVIAPSSRRTRFDVSAERGLTPFVGRERELDLLLDAFEKAKAGRGQAVSIVAEAGVGKSRLLYEFRKAVVNENVTFLEGKCLSYSRAITYHPIIDILKSTFDIEDTDADKDIKEKIKRGLKQLGVDEAATSPFLQELLSVKDSGIDKIALSPEGKKERTFESLKAIVLKASELRPLIMAVEDLHWMDKSSRDVSKYILEAVPGAAVLLIFTYRPEFEHSWGTKSYVHQITLNRLSTRESVSMVSHILDAAEVDRSVDTLILENTDGVPFFIEEFTKSIRDLKVIERKGTKYYLGRDSQSVAIPATIQDVIMARVDSLPSGAKEVLQAGSVIEREFGYELIRNVSNLTENDLLSYLNVLREFELLYERGIHPLSTYVFKHALTQQVVYDSILTKRRQELHGKVGNAIENLYKSSLDGHYAVLARHFIENENYELGAHYSRLAARKAQKAASYSEAIEHGKKRVACLEKLPKTDVNQKKQIDGRARLAAYNMNLNHHFAAYEAVAPVVDLAVDLDYQRPLPGIYTAIATYYQSVLQDYPTAFQYFNDAIKTAKSVGDFLSLWFANYFLGEGLGWNCEFEQSVECFNECIKLSEAANYLPGVSVAKSSIIVNYYCQGELSLAYNLSEESLVMAKEIGDIFIQAMACSAHGSQCYLKGFLDEAENLLVEGFGYSERTNQLFWGAHACFWLGLLYIEKGDYKRAEDTLERGISSFLKEEKVFPQFANMFDVLILDAKVLGNDRGVVLGELSRFYENNKAKLFEGRIAAIIGEILLNIDAEHLTDAEYWIKKAIEVNANNRITIFQGFDFGLYAKVLKRRGEFAECREMLAKAVDVLRQFGADGWVKKYEEELVALT